MIDIVLLLLIFVLVSESRQRFTRPKMSPGWHNEAAALSQLDLTQSNPNMLSYRQIKHHFSSTVTFH